VWQALLSALAKVLAGKMQQGGSSSNSTTSQQVGAGLLNELYGRRCFHHQQRHWLAS
jgi:hypothetical protein